jgi:NarL family two-component system sensor histidine kinase LiaS
MDTIKKWRWPTSGLQWRIMVSYFLVTLVAALTIECAAMVRLFVQGLPQQAEPTPQVLNRYVEQTIAQLTPYLEQTPVDQVALQSWLLGTFPANVSTGGSEPVFVAIVDQHGQPLVAASCRSSQSFSPQRAGAGPGSCTAITDAQTRVLLAPNSTQAALNAALAGAQQPVEVPSSANQTIIASPVFSAEGQVLGALVADGNVGTDPSTAVSASNTHTIVKLVSVFLGNIQSTFYFVLLATAIGTITGVLISGGITRRLRRIMLAAAAWSRGEFQVTVFDRSGDEVGQLVHDLNQMARQLQTLLAARQELAVLEERNRMARDLHDAVKQHVFANALLIRAARKMVPRNPDKAQAHLAEAEELADQAQQELSVLIRALRPAAISDKGLVAALQDYTNDWQRRMGVEVKMSVQGAQTTPLESEETLFRVAQEALANVARHSHAQQVELSLTWSADQVHLTIHDNGKGFDPAHLAEKGMGLSSMRERVEALHGTFLVSSSEAGTTIKVSVTLSTLASARSRGGL